MARNSRTRNDWRSQVAVAGSFIGLALIGAVGLLASMGKLPI